MKKSLLNLLIGTCVALSASSGKAAGESIGNPSNDCNTASGNCATTPTKFSAKVYRIALCDNSPMESPSTSIQWSQAGCQDIYNNPSGETTGDILSGSGAGLSSQYISLPPAKAYSKVVALVSNVFSAASHHTVVAAGTSTPVNGNKYISTATGGATAGSAGSEQLYNFTVNSFAPQINCNSAYSSPNSKSDTGVAGNGFNGRLLNTSFEMPITGSGNINTGSGSCDNAAYILVIVDKSIAVSSSALGIDIKIRATKGAAIVNQGTGDGVVTGFGGAGASLTYDVSTF